jgi:hypothetical protein
MIQTYPPTKSIRKNIVRASTKKYILHDPI